MKDLRGVERGKCTKCTCTAYELEKGATRSACSYCECPAPAHVEVLCTAASSESCSMSFLDKTSSTLDASDASDTIVIDLQKNFVSDLLSNSVQHDEPNTDEILDVFPKRFPKSVETAMQNKAVKGNHKDIICQRVVDKLYEQGWDNNRCLKKAAKGMQKRWSPFKSKVDPDANALSEKLRRRRDRLNESKASKSATADSEAGPSRLTPDQAATEMRVAWASGSRSLNTYVDNMAISRKERQKEAKVTPAMQHLRNYPALGLSEVLILELEFDMGIKKDEMLSQWCSALPKLCKMFAANKIECDAMGTADETTVSILQNLHKIPLWHKKKLEDKRNVKVLEVFEENVPLDEMRPGPVDPPRLLVQRSHEGPWTIHCYVDTEPLFTTTNVNESLLLLLAAYYSFHISWPANVRLPLIFLVAVVCGPLKVAKEIAKNYKFQDLLKQYDLANI